MAFWNEFLEKSYIVLQVFKMSWQPMDAIDKSIILNY